MENHVEEGLYTIRDRVKRKNSAGKFVTQEITLLLISRPTRLYVEIHEEPTLELLHELQRKHNVSW